MTFSTLFSDPSYRFFIFIFGRNGPRIEIFTFKLVYTEILVLFGAFRARVIRRFENLVAINLTGIFADAVKSSEIHSVLLARRVFVKFSV